MNSSLLLFVALALGSYHQCIAYHVPIPITTKRAHRGPISIQPQALQPLHASIARSPSAKSPLFAEMANDDLSQDDEKKRNAFGRFIDMCKPKSSENLSTKELLAKMGLSTLLSYGFVSNMSYCISVSIAWFGFTKKTGLSPLAPGQWKAFLAVYAGFYVFNNIVRPLRIGLSIGVAKYFDSAISMIQEKLKVSKPIAIGIVVFMANIVGTCSLMALGITGASALSGVPVFPPKV